MQAMFSVVVVVTVVALAAACGGPAAAKGQGLIRLMDQRGHVSTIKGDRAAQWWEHLSSSKCSSCRSPKQAAALLAKTSSAGRRGARIFMLKPRYLGVSWPRAWILYASTRKTPAYVVVRGGVAYRGKQWDSWTRVGRRVERIILGSSQGSSEDFLTAPTESKAPRQLPIWAPSALVVVTAGLLMALRPRPRTSKGTTL
jgi:hypothetical protein